MSNAFSLLIKLRRATYLSLGLLDRAVLRKQNSLFILSYHSVANDNWRFSINEKEIKKQIVYLQKHFAIITLKTLTAYLKGRETISKPSVVLTFDDGYKDIVKLKSFFEKQN